MLSISLRHHVCVGSDRLSGGFLHDDRKETTQRNEAAGKSSQTLVKNRTAEFS